MEQSQFIGTENLLHSALFNNSMTHLIRLVEMKHGNLFCDPQINSYLNKSGHGRSAKASESRSSKLSHNSGAVGRGLSDFRLRACDEMEQMLGKMVLIIDGARSCVLYHVVEDTQTPLMI